MFGWFKKKSDTLDNPLSLDAALDCYRRGRFQEALQRAGLILESAPVALSWRFKGECLFELERYGEAAKCFEKSELIGGPGTEDAFIWRALSLYNGGNRIDAKRVLMDFLNSGSENAELIEQAENALRQLGVST